MSHVLETISELASPWAYVVVGLLAALEASAFVGLFVPGELAMLVGGYVALQGNASLSTMMIWAVIGAVVGDSIGYEIGKHFGTRIRETSFGKKISPARWDKAEQYLATKGGKAVFFGRFVGVLRALVPALAGMSRMPYRKFLFWNACGGLIWAPTFVFLGYLAGSSYRRVEHYAGRASLLLLAMVVVIAGIVIAARRIIAHSAEVQSFFERQLERPRVHRLVNRYRAPIQFLLGRFRSENVLGLSLTIELALLAFTGWIFGVVFADVAARNDLVLLDRPITRFIVAHRESWLTTTMKLVTSIGSIPTLLALVLVLGLWGRYKKQDWKPLVFLLLALGGAFALSSVLKPLVGRPRPDIGPILDSATSFSFPSGHATQSAAVYIGMAWVITQWISSYPRKAVAWAFMASITVLIGFSRIYLGAHWTSDIVGGMLLGTVWVIILVATTNTVVKLHSPPQPADRDEASMLGAE